MTQPRTIDTLLDQYGESHRNPRNGAIHCVAIPMIMVSLVGLMYALHPWADLRPAGQEPSQVRKLWHQSPGSAG